MQSSLNSISGPESLTMLREAHRSLVDTNRQLLSENARLREQHEEGGALHFLSEADFSTKNRSFSFFLFPPQRSVGSTRPSTS